MNNDKELVKVLDIVSKSLKELSIADDLYKTMESVFNSQNSKKEKLDYIIQIANALSEQNSTLNEIIIDYFSLFVVCSGRTIDIKRVNPANAAVYKHTSRLIKNVLEIMKDFKNT